MQFMEKLLVVILIVVGVLFALSSTNDELDVQEDHYRIMVCAGHWPDYDNVKPDCGE